jgi:hypothetical protein
MSESMGFRPTVHCFPHACRSRHPTAPAVLQFLPPASCPPPRSVPPQCEYAGHAGTSGNTRSPGSTRPNWTRSPGSTRTNWFVARALVLPGSLHQRHRRFPTAPPLVQCGHRATPAVSSPRASTLSPALYHVLPRTSPFSNINICRAFPVPHPPAPVLAPVLIPPVPTRSPHPPHPPPGPRYTVSCIRSPVAPPPFRPASRTFSTRRPAPVPSPPPSALSRRGSFSWGGWCPCCA